MRRNVSTVLLFLAATSLARGALVWSVGRDDNGWPVGDGGGPDTTFVQENAIANELPGSPFSTEVNFGADNDYYFAGDYSSVIAGNGVYVPVGLVEVNEEAAERAFSASDNDLRFHFNLPASFNPNDFLSITFDAFNLDTAGGTDPRYGVEVFVNGVLVMEQVVVRPGQLDTPITTPLFTQGSVGLERGAGFDNIVSLRGTNYNGSQGGNWMGIDYVQLDAEPIPEPGSTLLIFLGALGAAAIRHRRPAAR
jgi:hypothetical protein